MGFRIIFFATVMFFSSQAFASLGDNESSIQEDAQSLGGQDQVTQLSQYRLHEISQNSIRVHEFATDNGNVFALAWHGKKHPELQGLLSTHLSDFQKP